VKNSEGSGANNNFWYCFLLSSVTFGAWVIVQRMVLRDGQKNSLKKFTYKCKSFHIKNQFNMIAATTRRTK